MKCLYVCCIVLALVLGLNSQLTQINIDKTSPQFNDPQFLKIINNYFGCKKWENGRCVTCSDHFFFNSKGICCEVKPECKNFNIDAGLCEVCYTGYAIVNGKCVINDIAKTTELGCKTFQNNACVECSFRYYFNANRVCQQVDRNCRTWQQSNGSCTQCYPGYQINNNQCQIVQNPTGQVTANPFCKDFNNTVCIRCSQRAQFNSNGLCIEISSLCNTWDRATRQCLTCYKGYQLFNGNCTLTSAGIRGNDIDAGCAIFDWDKQVCLSCSMRYFFNAQGKCIQLDNNCQQYGVTNGICVKCYKGYQLSGQQCVRIANAGFQKYEIGCKNIDFTNKICLQCSQRYSFDQDGFCVAMDDNCRQFDNNKTCIQCYRGYQLSLGRCFIITNTNGIRGPDGQIVDEGCKNYDFVNNRCTECSFRFAFNSQGKCIQLDNNCKSFNTTGSCVQCYKGYEIKNNVCSISQGQFAFDLGCKTWNWDQRLCLQCSFRYRFNQNSQCVPLDDNCQNFNNVGECVKCYRGYDLVQGRCNFSPSNTAAPRDIGCKQWNWNTQTCLSCSNRWRFNAQGVCTPLDNNCQSFDLNAQCVSCYKGYNIVNNICVVSDSSNVTLTNVGCGKWNWDNKICLQCSQKWRFNAQGTCVPLDDNCKTFNNANVCTECYKGYALNNQTLCVAQQRTFARFDLGCKTWDWDNQVCLECSLRWLMNSNGICTPLDTNCQQFNNAGVCMSCYKGYDLTNGICVLSKVNTEGPKDLGCKTWDWDRQICLQCSARWRMANGVCQRLDDNCRIFSATGTCNECYKGYDLISGRCQFSSSNTAPPKDIGCKTWDWDKKICLQCSQRWIFNAQNICVPLDDNCQQFAQNFACQRCYKGYDLTNGICVYSVLNTALPTDLGCAEWDWANQICLKCSKRWIFNSLGRCVRQDDNCAQFNATGVCIRCFKGFDLINGGCALSAQNVLPGTASDVQCATWDWDKQICLKCANRYVFNANNICVPVSNLCETFSAAGLCTACYKGYSLVNGTCILNQTTINISDIGCKLWNWDQQRCLECSFRYVFNTAGKCIPVNNQCRQFDLAGNCTRCYTGYMLQAGRCNQVNPLCKTVDQNNVCLSCYDGFVFYKGSCTPLSRIADIALYYAECCPEKLIQLKNQGRL